MPKTVRRASHAGSWYTEDGPQLARELDTWLNQVRADDLGVSQLPVAGARIIIAPHAGYAYSGPAAAWAYKCLDISKAKHIFLLGPSHHLHLPNCALSGHTHYATPLGDIPLDIFVIRALRSSGLFRELSTSEDAAEHSLEMHLPYIQQLLLTNFPDPSDRPPLTPIMVGATSKATERQFGQLLAPYLSDPTTIFIISSDFCHWGTRFDYTYYLPRTTADIGAGVTLHKSHKPTDPPVHESIRRIDQASMDAVETGSHDAFVGNLAQTQNTVCGRHPIGVMMAAMEAVLAEQAPSTTQQGSADGKFRFVRYERSSDVVDGRGSSVSYASAYAVFDGA